MRRFSAVFRNICLGGVTAVALSLGLTACGGGGTSYTPAPPTSVGSTGAGQTFTYQLGSGDKVAVRVFGEPDLSGEFEIDGNGMLSLPLIGTIQGSQRSPRDLEQAIRERLAAGYLVDPQVSVEVLNYRPFYILGEVKVPGSYPYVNGMTILNAVALAGGYTYRAREGSAELKRAGTTTPKTVSPNTSVFPGDVITIEERYF